MANELYHWYFESEGKTMIVRFCEQSRMAFGLKNKKEIYEYMTCLRFDIETMSS